ncbi:hypothetical protein H4Q26_017966 [Puccinia striiformis f. sp. tritici PST-130]|nr:hypothetical protein H4Q26_017966 [Puccinia striiformis f. sp. tritici PST-130]
MALYDLDKTKPQPVSSEPHSLLSLSCGHKLMKTFHLYRLLKSPPSDFKNAKSVFESLSTCVTDFSQSPWNRMLITEAAKFDALAGSAEEYLQVLRNITADVHLLGHSLRRAMQLNEATLLEPLPTKTKQTFEEEDKKIKASQPFVHISALPGEVVIIDDPHSYSPFTKVIIACPQEEVCKQLAKTERSEEIRQLIVERTALFLHERQMGARDNVIRDVEWLKQNLTGEIDWFELASSICKLILAHQKLSDSLSFMTILQTSLKNLQGGGKNVDCIINAQKAERDAALQRTREATTIAG